MIYNRALLVLIAGMLGFLGSGCMGISGGRIDFDGLKYPVSMSGSLYGPNDEVVKRGEGLEPVKGFEFTKNYWSTFYSIIPLSRTSDIVEQMNKEIAEAGGDGMIYVSVSSDYSNLNHIFFLDLLPIWPGCSKIRVFGTIVKLVKTEADTGPGAPAAAPVLRKTGPGSEYNDPGTGMNDTP